jgi:glutathione synthase/RimK-type ligase-like ATP-grasp enzyme
MSDLDEDGGALITALAELGVEARPAIWDDEAERWSTFDLVVLRCTWDYVAHHHRFVCWARSVPHLANRAPVVEWNTDKHYLADLAGAGVPTVETVFLEPRDVARNEEVPFADRLRVIKPVVSAGSRDTARYGPADTAAARDHVEELLAEGRSVMVQPYLHHVDVAGETALIYLNGDYSHAVGKAALLTGTERHADGLWRPEAISPRVASDAERAVADRALTAVATLVEGGDDLAYARVDVVHDQHGSPVVLEVELTEPSLFLGYDDRAPHRLAASIASRVASRT